MIYMLLTSIQARYSKMSQLQYKITFPYPLCMFVTQFGQCSNS